MRIRASAAVRRISATLAVLSLAAGQVATGTEAAAGLRPDTINAFETYVRRTEARLEAERRETGPFLWVDRLPEQQRLETCARLHRGEIVVARLETRDNGRRIEIPGGMSHHWVGSVFAADTALDRVVTLMQAYDRYEDIYRLAVRRSRMLSREDNRFTVYLQLYMRRIVTVVLNTVYDVRYVPVTPSRMQVRSRSTRIAEVHRPDTPQEQERPAGQGDRGVVWRLNNYCALEARDGGTYIQCESVSLSRDIPTGLGWLIGPFVTSVPRESLEITLRAMRDALVKAR